MGNKPSASQVVFPPAVPGKSRLCVSGFSLSTHAGRAQQIASLIARTYPNAWDSWFFFSSSAQFRGPEQGLLPRIQAAMPADHPLRAHRTSPFCWVELTEPAEGTYQMPARPDCHILPLGGRDRLCEYVLRTFPADDARNAPIREAARNPTLGDAWVDETPGTVQAH
eukprot:TRINITY_DN1172_c0_g1_i1.p1 TRINITY_DN1172_c0_g1~~TRINITY_DN1172_c0_g1_i1.p1  ORF type:complete len:178 (+),score=29.86 TRINITY_DN1172_c0_g1_i1:35-535(+)